MPDPGGEAQRAIAACLARFLPAGGRLAVGYSGGLDSTVLLHALAGLRQLHHLSVSAVHVHHGLSPQADAWAAHCQGVCDALEIPLTVHRVRVNPAGQGLEAAARQARYQVFSTQDADAILLAQHQDDQAETVLLQLRRGASAKGMSAMPECRQLVPGKLLLLRPFLGLTRTQLEAFAKAHGLSWVEDESNLDPSLARNHVRHTLLPLLDAVVPGMSPALTRAAEQFAEWSALLDALADSDGASALDHRGLDTSILSNLPEARARNLLRRVLEQAGVQVRRAPLMEATRQLREACANSQVRVDFGGASVARFQGRVQVVPSAMYAPVPDLGKPWRGEVQLDLGLAGWLDFKAREGAGVELLGHDVLVRHRRGGDRLRLRPGQLARPVKDLLREAGIPPWLRPWLPVVEVDGRVAWVGGLGENTECRAGPGRPGWLIAWAPPW
ncbi:MAG: tRNA lysidine(34) synthetase TilS [Thiobacillus sp.]|nr:tRNA lysidine(34) synthetase TilS [Thiobacillus sp.]